MENEKNLDILIDMNGKKTRTHWGKACLISAQSVEKIKGKH